MNVPSNLKYSKDHAWLRKGDDVVCTVGITDHAQHLLGDVVFVDLPKVGKVVSANDFCAMVESLKANSDVHSPVSGEVVEVNGKLNDDPSLINEDPHGEGWLFKVKVSDVSSIDALLDAAAYAALLKSE